LLFKVPGVNSLPVKALNRRFSHANWTKFGVGWIAWKRVRQQRRQDKMKTERAPGKNTELRIASRIANEFQTPLGVIISAGELLEGYFERLTPDRRRLALEDILSAARQMNNTMDLLTGCKDEARKNSRSTAREELTNHRRPELNRRSRQSQAPHTRL
jgi:signal transduction histidine kinase